MKERFTKVDIEVRLSPIHRYGVFAIKDIAPKEIIEECPAIIFYKLLLESREAICDRIYAWDDKSAFILGYGSMYNHAKEPNAAYAIDRQNQLMQFIAIKPIAAGEEILVDYGEDWFSSRTSFPANSQNDSFGPFRVILFLLILLALSKIFPIGLYGLSANINPPSQTSSVPKS